MKKNIPAEHQRYNIEVDGAIPAQVGIVTATGVASIALLGSVLIALVATFDCPHVVGKLGVKKSFVRGQHEHIRCEQAKMNVDVRPGPGEPML